MTEEFNLHNERKKWFNKWITKRLTGRAVAEFKQIDKEFIKRLKEELNNEVKIAENMKVINQHEIIDNLAGEDLK